jgi:hypothetical protein
VGALQAGIFLAVKLCEFKRKPNPNGSILVDYCSPWKATRRDQVLEERDGLGRTKTNSENELQDKKDKMKGIDDSAAADALLAAACYSTTRGPRRTSRQSDGATSEAKRGAPAAAPARPARSSVITGSARSNQPPDFLAQTWVFITQLHIV